MRRRDLTKTISVAALTLASSSALAVCRVPSSPKVVKFQFEKLGVFEFVDAFKRTHVSEALWAVCRSRAIAPSLVPELRSRWGGEENATEIRVRCGDGYALTLAGDGDLLTVLFAIYATDPKPAKRLDPSPALVWLTRRFEPRLEPSTRVHLWQHRASTV